MKRIRYGLDKYGNSEFIIYLDHSKAGNLSSGIIDAINTQTTAQVAAIITSRYTSGIECRVKGITEAIGTQPGDVSHGVFGMPAIIKNYGGGLTSGINEKLGTITCTDTHGVLGMPFIVENYGTSKSKKISDALGCITAGGINHGVLSNESINAFLSYYYGTNNSSGINDATGTITTKDRIALVMKPTGKIDIEDCTYRMLKPHEIQAAMAFESDYVVCGNSRDKVKQLGNAVTPPAMEWLLERGIETFM